MICAALVAHGGRAGETEWAGLLKASGVDGGLVVCLGCGDDTITGLMETFGPDAPFVIHGLDTAPSVVAAARLRIRSLGRYGQVSVDLLVGDRLPYVDNLVNLVVVSGDKGRVSREEILRVLAPNGVALISEVRDQKSEISRGAERLRVPTPTAGEVNIDGRKWAKIVKRWPREIDEWTHALYDSSNNAVASDSVVGPPHHLQWVGAPRNTRHHERLASVSVVVSAAGRLFYIVDEAPTGSILLRPKWSLVARNAFNGVMLWKRRIAGWESYMKAFRSGPPELSRRLVAAKDRVYVTLGLKAPVSALNAATGETIRTYEGTEGTEEMLLHQGALFLVVSDAGPTQGKSIVAVDGSTGRVLWRKPDARPMPTTLAVAAGRAFYQSSEAVACLDSKTGEPIWRHERSADLKRPTWSAPTLVVHGGVVLCADRRVEPTVKGQRKRRSRVGGELVALAADTGKKLWTCKCAETFHAPVDVLVADGLVWVGESPVRKGPDFTTGRDLLTGEVARRISPDKAFQTTMYHHRCYRNRATNRYIVAGRTGVEFIDLVTGAGRRHHWVRGVCQYGILPCNGLLYAPPHSCACYIEGKLAGFYALAAGRSEERGTRSEGDRVERGPAFGSIPQSAFRNPHSEDWPTFRHDAARSGVAKTRVPVALRRAWQVELGGQLTSPVIADGTVLVASVDAHTVYALDARDGRQLWLYTVGGRVDSPPAICQERVVFGSADGWVYCLRTPDGTLAWRFRAAPEDRRGMAFGQVESVWPVHGSVLVQDGVVYCVAGRSSYLDDGLYVYRLDLATGKKLSETRVYSRDPETGEQPDEPDEFEMPGALPDVLSFQDGIVYMRHLGLHPQTLARCESQPHLYSPAGFLNDAWWHRTYWVYGTHFYSGYIGWYFAGRETPAGRLLVMDDSAVYGFGYEPSSYRGATGRKYHLFATDKRCDAAKEPPDYKRSTRDYRPKGKEKAKFKVEFRWAKSVPLLARAMVLAGKTLFVAGPPTRALRSTLAFEGNRGGYLAALSVTDGSTLAKYRLGSLPVFDGLIAARGRLYMSAQDGRLSCMGEEGQTVLETAGTAGKEASRKSIEPGLAGHWPFDDGPGEVARDRSGLGNDAEVYSRWAKGEFGTCVSTDGTSGAIVLCDGPHLHFGTDDFTIAFWLKPHGIGWRLMLKSSFPQNWWAMNLRGDGKVEMVLGESTAPGKSVRPTSRTALSTERWNHVALVVSRKERKVTCYIDGQLDSTTAIPPTLTGSLSIEGKDLEIPSTSRPVHGLFDDLRIYTRSLTATEVKRHYERGKGNRISAAFRYAEE